MRRKLLLVVFFVMLASGFCGYRFAAHCGLGGAADETTASLTSRENLAVAPVVETADNGLVLQVLGENQAVAYQLTLQNDFQQAAVAVNPSSLTNEAYVRILDAAGNLVAGEYTTIYDSGEGAEESETPAATGVEYYFPGTPKSYQVALTPGMKIEVQAEQVRFTSTLDEVTVTELAPRAKSETYVVMEGGLRREDWSEAETQEVIYRQLKRYTETKIGTYRAEIPEHVLHNKTLDTEKKAEIMRLYAKLAPVDQETYTDFIAELRRGGTPTMTYRGALEYKLGERVDFLELIDVHDNEDDEIASKDLKAEGEVDFDKPGSYELIYTATDSDGNIAQLKLTIVITEERVDTPSQIPSENRPVTMPAEGNDGNNVAGMEPEPIADSDTADKVDAPEFGGGTGVGSEDTGDAATIWGAQELRVDYGEETDAEVSETEQAKDDSVKPATPEKATMKLEQKTEKTMEQAKAAEGVADTGGEVNVFLIILGGLAICGLLKFIFDHYIR